MPYVSVHIDAEDVLEELSDTDIEKELKRRQKTLALSVPLGAGDGDATFLQRLVDQAEFAARGLPDCPAQIKDLLWHVHGRALP